MLNYVASDVLREKRIDFKSGLNVVLGDDNGTNSIGKTSLLLIIDFSFGGNQLTKNDDIVRELGHHKYEFSLTRNGQEHIFSRNTNSPEFVYQIDSDDGEEQVMTIDEYRARLKVEYSLPEHDLSYRQWVSIFSRIWGKDNYTVSKPLHIVPSAKMKDCVDYLIKIFGHYAELREKQNALKSLENEATALRRAFAQSIVKKVNKTEYKTNTKKIEAIDKEILEIKENIALYMSSIEVLEDREYIEGKSQKDSLVRQRFDIISQLTRTRENLKENRHIQSKSFERLQHYFPDINIERIAQVEEFHSNIAKHLKTEIKANEKTLVDQLNRIDRLIQEIDAVLLNSLKEKNVPKTIVDRIEKLSQNKAAFIEDNTNYDKGIDLKDSVKATAKELDNARLKILKKIEAKINKEVSVIAKRVVGQSRKSPTITLNSNNYEFEVFEDTGTGTAYLSLILFDLAMRKLVDVPILIHDSFLFKNIENNSLAKLLSIHLEHDRQSFISIDEKEKYGQKTAKMLEENRVLTLGDGSVLFTKDWRPAQ